MTTTPQRRTRQRTAIAEVLDELDEFRTAQEIHDLLRQRDEPVGLATVYRTLQTMVDADEADVIRTSDGQAAYRGCGQKGHHHHHLICRDCGKTVEFSLTAFETIFDALATEHGFTEVDHHLELFGLCSDCGA